MVGILKKIAAPLALLLVLVTFYYAWRWLGLPDEKELILIVERYFERYGLITVFVSAIIEGLLLFGLYYPGSIVIFLGVIFAGGDVSKIIKVIIVATAGMMVSYTLNFLAGKYGWYRLLVKLGLEQGIEKAKARLEKHETQAILGTYWHPNFAALTSTAAGILNMSVKKFLLGSLLVASLWNTFWGILAASLGERALKVIGARFAIGVVIVWILYLLWQHKFAKES